MDEHEQWITFALWTIAAALIVMLIGSLIGPSQGSVSIGMQQPQRTAGDERSPDDVSLSITMWRMGAGQGASHWRTTHCYGVCQALLDGPSSRGCAPGGRPGRAEAYISGMIGTRHVAELVTQLTDCDQQRWGQLRPLLTEPRAARGDSASRVR